MVGQMSCCGVLCCARQYQSEHAGSNDPDLEQAIARRPSFPHQFSPAAAPQPWSECHAKPRSRALECVLKGKFDLPVICGRVGNAAAPRNINSRETAARQSE